MRGNQWSATECARLIETLAAAQPNTLATKASPTLANQETVSLLFQRISERTENKQTGLSKIALLVEFAFRLLGNLVFYLLFAVLCTKNQMTQKNVVRTWLVSKSIKQHRVADDYFRDEFLLSLESLLLEKPAELYMPLGLGKNISDFCRLREGHQYISFDFLNIADILFLFYTYLMNGRVSKFIYLPDKDLQSFCEKVCDSVQVDFFKFRSFQFFVELFVAKKILHKKENFFYVFENQAYEQAWLEVADLRKVKTLGFQSSGFSNRFFNFFPSAVMHEIQKHPAVILAASSTYARILNDGFVDSKITTVGTNRIQWDVETNWNFDLKIRSKKILVLLPVHFTLYKKVIDQFESQFDGKQVEVWYRPHPLNIKKMKRTYPKLNSRLQDPKKTSRGTFLEFRCCFSFDNSLAFDALLSGTITYEITGVTIYDDSRFIEFSTYDSRIPLDRLTDGFVASTHLYTVSVIREQVRYCNLFYQRFHVTDLERALK